METDKKNPKLGNEVLDAFLTATKKASHKRIE